jgi:hypothetical protein
MIEALHSKVHISECSLGHQFVALDSLEYMFKTELSNLQEAVTAVLDP